MVFAGKEGLMTFRKYCRFFRHSTDEIMMKDQILIKSEKCEALSLPPSKQPAQSVNAFNQVSLAE